MSPTVPGSKSPAAKPVFISYARKASRDEARALHQALAAEGIDAFLDTADIEDGEQFPRRIVDALLGSKVVAILASETYFER